MADFIKLTVTGLEDLTRALNALPKQSERNAVKPAIRKAAKPIKQQALANVKARTKVHTGNLRKAFSKREVSYEGAFVLVLGPRYAASRGKTPRQAAPHAHLVEEGTTERFRKKRKRRSQTGLVGRGKGIKKGASTGKMPAFHPVRDAFLSKGDEAVRIAERELWKGIEKEAAKLGRRSRVQ